MSYREWFPTFTGKKIYPLKFKEEDFDIRDVAHQLSLTARFGGATHKLCSVAQHSVLVAGYTYNETGEMDSALWGLLHDAAEAYIGDMKIGIKDMFPEFKKLEDNILRIIITIHHLTWPMPDVIKKWDWTVGCNEAFTLIEGGSPEFYNVKAVQKIYMTSWTAEYAEKQFLKVYNRLKSS